MYSILPHKTLDISPPSHRPDVKSSVPPPDVITCSNGVSRPEESSQSRILLQPNMPKRVTFRGISDETWNTMLDIKHLPSEASHASFAGSISATGCAAEPPVKSKTEDPQSDLKECEAEGSQNQAANLNPYTKCNSPKDEDSQEKVDVKSAVARACSAVPLVESGARDPNSYIQEIDFSEVESSWKKLQQLCVAAPHNYLGFHHSQAGNYKEAIYHWEQAADQGYDKAHYNLGVCHEQGRGVEKDLVAAVHHYELAASQGHRGAQFNLAMILRRGGPGIRVDETASVDWLQAAAESGLPAACRELGVMKTEYGDMESATQLFTQAANLKDVAGQYYLELCCEYRSGIEKSEATAANCTATDREHHQEAQSTLPSFN